MSLINDTQWNNFIKLGLTGVILAPIAYVHFLVFYFEIKILNKVLKLYYIFAFISLISLYTNKFFFLSQIFRYNWGKYPNAGIFETLNLLITLLTISYMYAFFFIKYKTYKGKLSTTSEYNRFKYILLSFTIFAFSAIDYLPAYGIDIYPFGFIFFDIFAFLISYAMIKHHLLDINIVVRKGVIYSILVTIITLIYFIIVYISEIIFRGFIGYKSIVLTLTSIVLFILLFQPLKNKIQSFVDKYFFKGSQEMLADENERLMEEIRRSDRLKAVATLAAGMAHEIKNPLTSIKTFTEYLDEKHEDSNFREKFKRIVGSEVDKINTIVSQLLDFAKPKLLSLQRTDVHKLLDETLSLLSNELIKKRIDVVKDYGAKEASIIEADPNRLKQVFLNLFLNAMDAIKDGGKLIVRTKLPSERQTLEIIIEDTGCGINHKDLPHIFDPFYSTKESGTGLGLSIVHGIIKEHGGNIICESESGKGTKFIITLPS